MKLAFPVWDLQINPITGFRVDPKSDKVRKSSKFSFGINYPLGLNNKF
jgi:hypothetical protein